MKILHLPLFVGMLLLSIISHAGSSVIAANLSEPAAAPVQDVAINQSPAPGGTQRSELLLERKLLLQQNMILRESQESILSTVYWSLGAVFGMAFLLAGFSWINNHKIYSAEKDHLKREMESRIAQAASELQLKEQDLRTAFLQTIDERLESQANRISSDMYDVRSGIENLRERVGAATDFSENLESDTDSRLAEIGRRIDRGMAVAREIEEHVWQLKGIPANILVTQAQGLGASFAAKDEDGAKRVLARMKKTIEVEYIAKNKKISSLPSVIRYLEIVQEILPIETSEIIQMIKENMSPSGDIAMA